MDYNETSELWYYNRIYPDTIYPEIIFIASPINWNNPPTWTNIWRQNYQIFKMYNSFEMDSNMNLWIEFNTEPTNINNSGDLLVYVVASGVPLTYFTSDWRTNPNTQLVGTISRTTPLHHNHTPDTNNVRHHLIPISTNSNGTIGINNVDISDGNFYIVLYQDSANTNRGWRLAYKPTAICNNSNNWFTANRSGGNTWNLPIHSPGCPDVHIHFARRENIVDGINIEIIAKEGATTTTNSQSYYFSELPNLAPNQTSFITPMIGATYDTNNILISWNEATDPNNDSLTYDINYMDSDGNIFVIDGALTDTNIDWNILAVPDGNYTILGSVCDEEPLCTDFNLGGYFTIEREDPIYSLTNITISSNYSNTVYAKTDNNVTLSFNSTGILEDLAVLFYSGGGETINSALISNNDTNYTATYLVSSEDLEGLVSFTITASNLDLEYTSITDNSSVTIDNNSPTTTISGNSADWTNDNQTITLSCDDATSDCNVTEYRIDSGAWQTYTVPLQISTDGNHQIDYRSIDNAENTEVTKTTYAAIDKTPPTITLTDANENVIISNQIIFTLDTNFTFSFSAQDFNSGVKNYYVREGTGLFNLVSDLNYTISGEIHQTKRFSLLVQDNVLNQTLINITVHFGEEDADDDGISDHEDNLIANTEDIETDGVNDLNITIDDDTNIVGIFTGVQTIKIYDGTTPILEFDHNFSESTLDLSVIKIIKTNAGVVVDLNGQLQDDQNKTIYLENNNFISLCVENAPITSLSEISSNCSDANEYNFMQCLNGNYSVNGIDCALTENLITVSNLEYSGILGTLRSSSGGTSISKDLKDTKEEIVDGVTDTNDYKQIEEPIFETLEDKKPEENLVSSDRPNYTPDEEKTTIYYSKKSKNTTTIWIITYFICALIIGITIYLFTKIRYR